MIATDGNIQINYHKLLIYSDEFFDLKELKQLVI